MFFEFNGSIHDSEKLFRRRLLVKSYLNYVLDENLRALGFFRKENYWFCRDSLLILEINIFGVEEQFIREFSF